MSPLARIQISSRACPDSTDEQVLHSSSCSWHELAQSSRQQAYASTVSHSSWSPTYLNDSVICALCTWAVLHVHHSNSFFPTTSQDLLLLYQFYIILFLVYLPLFIPYISSITSTFLPLSLSLSLLFRLSLSLIWASL
jgi:hypothetical protein